MSAAFLQETRVIVNVHCEQARSYRLSVLLNLAHQLRLSLDQAAGLGQPMPAITRS
jgi:hypothetical protein